MTSFRLCGGWRIKTFTPTGEQSRKEGLEPGCYLTQSTLPFLCSRSSITVLWSAPSSKQPTATLACLSEGWGVAMWGRRVLPSFPSQPTLCRSLELPSSFSLVENVHVWCLPKGESLWKVWERFPLAGDVKKACAFPIWKKRKEHTWDMVIFVSHSEGADLNSAHSACIPIALLVKVGGTGHAEVMPTPKCSCLFSRILFLSFSRYSLWMTKYTNLENLMYTAWWIFYRCIQPCNYHLDQDRKHFQYPLCPSLVNTHPSKPTN